MPLLPAGLKCLSALRRIPQHAAQSFEPVPAFEGQAALFELLPDSVPITVEAVSGRFMTLIPNDLFLACPGHRESTRWVVGAVPPEGLQPNDDYWVLADSGVVGELAGNSPRAKAHLGQVRFRGVVSGPDGVPLSLAAAAIQPSSAPDHGAPVTVIAGTASEVGKTTAALAILQTLRRSGVGDILAIKATGTSCVNETARYTDYGAARTLDCVDAGLPTTYPAGRPDIAAIFDRLLDHAFALPAGAVVIELGGDLFGANVPVLLDRLKPRRPGLKLVLAASDALAALGAKSILDGMGLPLHLLTGPCTDTPTLRSRTQDLVGCPAMNLLNGQPIELPPLPLAGERRGKG